MFFPIRFKTHVQLVPHELDENIEKTLMVKLKKRYEGVCSRFGYIKPDTLQILHRSLGSFMKPHFNGHTRFEVLLIGDVCNPTQGMVVTATVQAKNNLGILAESSVARGGGLPDIPLLDIIVPRRSAGIASEVNLDDVAVGESVYVEVLGKRYQLNDTKISIIGRIVKEREHAANEVVDDGESEAEDADADGTDFDEEDLDTDVGGGGDGDGEDGDGEEQPANAQKLAQEAQRFAKILREGVSKTKGGVGILGGGEEDGEEDEDEDGDDDDLEGGDGEEEEESDVADE